MGDRVDELKGDLKRGLGSVTGDKRLEAEGQVQTDDARAKRKTKGALRQAGGALKERFGKLIGDEVTQAEGIAEKLRGKAERAG
ncbi:MAG: CsbD family protein [Chloroflexota bacterium]|nr:MAG: CsbD family protein [Chloroflexota bacterium]